MASESRSMFDPAAFARSAPFLVAFGGALGASARWALVSTLDPSPSLPWPTLIVNGVGCLGLGLLTGSPTKVRVALGVGLCGGLTTFSTFSVELADLLDRNQPGTAVTYLTSSLVVGIVAVLIGRMIRRAP